MALSFSALPAPLETRLVCSKRATIDIPWFVQASGLVLTSILTIQCHESPQGADRCGLRGQAGSTGRFGTMAIAHFVGPAPKARCLR